MNATQIKTRHGLILQGATAAALSQAGYSFREDYQYDPLCEKPDFLIPDENKPSFVVEVHQTDARNSFQMKILRSFTAVIEAKSHYGNDVISVDILFGDPSNEVPASNLKALFSFFDVNIVPRDEAGNNSLIYSLETSALKFASDENFNVQQAISELIKEEASGISEFSKLLKKILSKSAYKAYLFPLWDKERFRISKLNKTPEAGQPTYYKRMILRSLFLSNDHFEQLVQKQDPNLCSKDLQEQLIRTRLLTVQEEITGDHYYLEPYFLNFIADKDATYFRKLCEKGLKKEPSIYYFFEDIRDNRRRNSMVERFLHVIMMDRNSFLKEIKDNFNSGKYSNINHTRCWLADLMPLVVGESHNSFNRRMYQHPLYNQNLGNPFNNIVIRSPRLGSSQTILDHYLDIALSCFEDACQESEFKPNEVALSSLNDDLLKFRMEAAIKLQKFNPLYVIFEKISDELSLRSNNMSTKSILSDLSDPGNSAGKYDFYHITDGNKTIISNAVAVHDHHGDDKSKEWGARRRATFYRYLDDEIRPSEFNDALFILDGEWEDKDVKRLFNSGWNRIVRLGELEDELKKIFGIKKTIPIKQKSKNEISDDYELPLAAEDSVPIKIKRREKKK